MFRQYHGEVNGRDVSAYFYRGPVLEIGIKSTLMTRLGVSQTHSRTLTNLIGSRMNELEGHGMEDVSVYALDEGWGRALIAEPGVKEVMRRLTTPEDFFVFQHVILRPGRLYLMFSGNQNLFKFEISEEDVRGWLDDLMYILEAADRIGAPSIEDEMSSAERVLENMRSSPERSKKVVIYFMVGMVVFFGVVCAVSMLIAFWI